VFSSVDPRSPTPLYAQIAARVRLAIAAGELRAGDPLPSVRQLATRLRINPATVAQAYRDLEGEQLVQTRQGAGTFVLDVAHERRERDRSAEARRLVEGLLTEAARTGLTTGELRDAFDELVPAPLAEGEAPRPPLPAPDASTASRLPAPPRHPLSHGEQG
jgi:GntR family transcriptional regulator